MARLRTSRIILMFFEVILGISATTHWVVTENGRIQPELDSVFQMKRPYDLPAFLEQEKRMNAVELLHQKIMARKLAIDIQIEILNSIGDLESWLQSSNPECVAGKKSLEDFDFYASIVSDGRNREGIMMKDFLFDDDDDDDDNDDLADNEINSIPDCKETFPLDFSMHTFEHLSAMRNRKSLTQDKEKSLMKYLPPDVDLNKFAHQINRRLERNSTSWLHFNLAAIYWRIKGDAYNALECSRRAIVTAPKEYKDIPLLTTGGILHAAKYSAEAAIVLHAAIDHAPTESLHHLALGHVYAILGDYNRSVACYENALRLSSDLEEAKHAKFVVLCCQSLTNALTALQTKLDDIVVELHTRQNDYGDWLKLQEKILCERMKTPFTAFRAHRLVPILASRSQTCMQRSGDDSTLSCQITSDSQFFANNLRLDIDVSLQQLKNVENQVEKINDRMINTKILPTERSSGSKNLKEQDSEYSLDFIEPSNKPKYYNFQIKKSRHKFERKSWPDSADCDKQSLVVSDSKEYIPIYLPPENKGYSTHIFVNELIEMEPSQEHPLPWYPPACSPPDTYSKYISKSLLKAASANSHADTTLTSFLTNLVKGAEIAEIGQRILTATKSKVAAPWVLSMLASLHWRVVGKPRNALNCLQSALNTVPNKFKDVPLVSIASINHKFGLIDDALKTTKEALKINSIEPLTNFLYGSLLHIKGNTTGAIHHLKQTLRVEPDLFNGRALMLLRTLICKRRLITRGGNNNSENNIESCSLSYSPPEIIAKHDLPEGETVLCFGDGKDCKPIQCFAMKMNVDETTGP